MKKILPFAAVVSLAFFAGCDYVDVPQQAGSTPVIPPSDTVRRIFIEDITGHHCNNCPPAAEIIENLKQLYPGQVVGVAVHYGYFAEPSPPHSLPNLPNLPADAFNENFQSPVNNDYTTIFGVDDFGNPTGMVNHFGYLGPGSVDPDHIQIGTWAPRASTILAQPISAYIKLNPVYNASTRQLNLTVDGLFMVDTTGTYNLVVMLVEDGLTGCQLDQDLPAEIDTAYVFNHVLRDCVTPGMLTGATVMTGTIAHNSAFQYSLPAAYTVSTNFNAANCHLVAYLYNTADQGILQAAEADLQ